MKTWGRSRITKKNRTRRGVEKAKKKGVLNIKPLVVKSLPHSSSSLECAKGKAYKEKI
jgi:DNA invertase Pin-like site-specific DNA recombinase